MFGGGAAPMVGGLASSSPKDDKKEEAAAPMMFGGGAAPMFGGLASSSPKDDKKEEAAAPMFGGGAAPMFGGLASSSPKDGKKEEAAAPMMFGGGAAPAGGSLFGASAGGGGMFGAAAAPAGGALFGAAGGAPMFGGAAPAAKADEADDDAPIVNEEDKNDEPVAVMLNDGEKVEIESRCKGFLWDKSKEGGAGWSERGIHVARVICNADAGYSSLVVKHSAAPFKVLGQQGSDVAGLNCKLSAAVMGMMKQAGKTVTVFLPGSDGDIIKYLLRLKGDKEATELMEKIKKHS